MQNVSCEMISGFTSGYKTNSLMKNKSVVSNKSKGSVYPPLDSVTDKTLLSEKIRHFCQDMHSQNITLIHRIQQIKNSRQQVTRRYESQKEEYQEKL